MGVHENGYWEGVEMAREHQYDRHLSMALLNFFKRENVSSLVDLGCGMGHYVKHFKENQLNVLGFDGNPDTPQLSNNLCGVLDLSKEHRFEKPFDWVMSLEVGEHLPVQFEDIFINNLHINNKNGIVLSWALKDQGGLGHFNERSNEYIKNKICQLGYVNDLESENQLRQSASLSWFRNTIMVFRRRT